MSSVRASPIHGAYDELSKIAARDILDKAKELLKDNNNIKNNKNHDIKYKDKIILALPGGRSVAGIYKEFSKSKDPVWKNIHIFLVDERAVPISSEESNYKMILESFASDLAQKKILPEKNLHPLYIDQKEKDYGASRYYEELKSHGGKFDITLLGCGEDGHIAALFPNHQALDIQDSTYLFMDHSIKPPAKRITASVKLITDSRFIALMFIGESKKDAYERFKDSKIPIQECPAKIVNKSSEYKIYTDLEE